MPLTDTQSILLVTAAQRDDRDLHPLAPSLKAGGGVAKAIAALVKAGLAERREDRVFATDGGLVAIGIEPEQASGDTRPIVAAAGVPAPARASKAGLVLELIRREQGATLVELIAATGWLPHTTRAALTGLRKKGNNIERCKRGDATCYRIGGVA